MKTNDTLYYITFKVEMEPENGLLPQFTRKRKITVVSPQPYNGDARCYWTAVKDEMTRMGMEHNHGCDIQEITFVKEETVEGDTSSPVDEKETLKYNAIYKIERGTMLHMDGREYLFTGNLPDYKTQQLVCVLYDLATGEYVAIGLEHDERKDAKIVVTATPNPLP